MGVVEEVLAAEGGAGRDAMGFGELRDVLGCRLRPGGAAQDQERALGLGQALGEMIHVAGTRCRLRRGVALGIGDAGDLAQHVLRDRQHHRPGTPGCRDVEGLVQILRHPRRIIDLCHPFGELPEHAAVVDLLERLAVDMVAADLADEENERG